MAIFKKTEPKQEAPVEKEVKIEAPKPAEFQPVHKTLIGTGITFEGNFISNDPIDIRGAIHGDIYCTDKVTVFENAEYRGAAKVANVSVFGFIDGNVLCEGLADFASSGKMVGDLKTSELKTDPGSNFKGTMTIDYRKSANNSPEVENQTETTEQVDLSEEGDIPVTEADLFN